MERVPKLTYAQAHASTGCAQQTLGNVKKAEFHVRKQESNRKPNGIKIRCKCAYNSDEILWKTNAKQLKIWQEWKENQLEICRKTIRQPMHVLCEENNRKSTANPLENDGGFQERNKVLIPPDVERKTYPSMKEMSKNRAGVRGLPARWL